MRTNIHLVLCPFPLASGLDSFPGLSLGITLEDRQTRDTIRLARSLRPRHSAQHWLLSIDRLYSPSHPLKPQDFSLSVGWIHCPPFSISIYCLLTLFSSFFLPPFFLLPGPMSAQSSPIPSLYTPSFVCVKFSLPLPSVFSLLAPSIHHYPPTTISILSVHFSYRHVSIFSTALTPSYSLFLQWPFFIFSLSSARTSCSQGSVLPAGLYFTQPASQPARPQVDIAVLVSAFERMGETCQGVLQGAT